MFEILKNTLTILKKQQHQIFEWKTLFDAIPGSIYLKNDRGVYLAINAYAANKMLLLYPESSLDTLEIVGKTDYDLFPKKTADQYKKNDFDVMQTKKEITFKEFVILPNGKVMTQLSIKKPLLNEKGCVIGVVGNTVSIDSCQLMRVVQTNASISLTPAERKCLLWLNQGMAAKEIALKLNRSHRTIEKHLESIRRKMKCRKTFAALNSKIFQDL